MKRMCSLASIAVIFTVIVVGLPVSYAQNSDVTATSSALDNTIIVTIRNSGATDIHSVRIWLAEGNSFDSFKTSGGWVGLRQAPNLLTFTTSTPIGNGESVKFGVVTTTTIMELNWQALDAADSEIARNVTIPDASLPPTQITPTDNASTESSESGILDDSAFKIIPSNPNIGSQIRVAGEGFGAQKTLTLLLGTLNLSTIDTGDSGRFVHTVRIPESASADRVGFTLTDNLGGTINKSIRLGEATTRMVLPESSGLIFNDIPATTTVGNTIELGGSGTPGELIIVTIVHPAGYTIGNSKIRIDSNGLWSKPFSISTSSSEGIYIAIVTDGATTLKQSLDVETGTIIDVVSSRISYSPGDELIFRGTAIPNEEMLVRLVSPQNIVLYEDAIEIDSTGTVGFEIPTLTSHSKGTYALFLSQGILENVIPVGIGGRADNLFVITTDKLNYLPGDSGIITIRGTAESEAMLSIANTAKHETLLSIPIRLDVDGLYIHELDLTDYANAVYTITASYGKNSSDYEFSIGFMYNAGELDIYTIKSLYAPTEPIVAIGTATRNNSLVDIALVSPSGVEVQTSTEFATGTTSSNASRKSIFFYTIFFVHSNSELGLWKITTTSGNDIAETTFEVLYEKVEGIVVDLKELDTTTGSSILISGSGAEFGTQLEISITYNLIDVIEDQLLVRSTGSGTFSLEWTTDQDLYPGTYTITVSDLSGKSTVATWIVE